MIYPSDLSRDGRFLLCTRATGTSTDLYYIPLDGDRTPHPFLEKPFHERDGQFSPDGRWVAYQANEGGHYEVYLQRFPGGGDRVQVSAGGGQYARWAGNGSELFYVAADQRLTSVRILIGADGKAVVAARTPLFRFDVDGNFLSRQPYAVSSDGRRFLVNAATDAVEPPSIMMLLNWKGKP